MNTLQIPEIGDLLEYSGKDILSLSIKTPRRATVTIEPDRLLRTAGYLYKDMHFRFIIATAIDTGEFIEILYHFSLDKKGLILNVRVILDRNKPEVESLTVFFEAASWIEREMHELFGINFLNHPNLEKLISDGNWAEGVYPYRKN